MRQKAKLLLVAYRGDNSTFYSLRTREDAPAQSLANAQRLGIKLATNKQTRNVFEDSSYEFSSQARVAASNAGFETITPQKLQGMTRGIKLKRWSRQSEMAALRVCYIWEMGMMVKNAKLEQLREKRLKELEKRRELFAAKYRITKKEKRELADLKFAQRERLKK